MQHKGSANLCGSICCVNIITHLYYASDVPKDLFLIYCHLSLQLLSVTLLMFTMSSGIIPALNLFTILHLRN